MITFDFPSKLAQYGTVNNESILIVGSGVFGSSTAYHLLKRGYDVTIIDGSLILPAPDCASNDFNRIVRSSYSDLFYAELAREAIEQWKTPMYGGAYHESGIIVLGSQTSEEEKFYVERSCENESKIGCRLKKLNDPQEILSAFPQSLVSCIDKSVNGTFGYRNHDGGWADARLGLIKLHSSIREIGGNIIPGKSAQNLLREDGKIIGVACTDGSSFYANEVVLATGAWTASIFPELKLQKHCLATGQSIAMVQLNSDETNKYKASPVVLRFDSGFFVFPPTEEGIVKFAIHGAGFTNIQDSVSIPKDGLSIPKTMLDELRKGLSLVYPELAKKNILKTRLCWYNDTTDGDWLIGPHPEYPNLIVASGDSGHAYKFLPCLGRLVADAIENKLDPKVAERFSLTRVRADSYDPSRPEMKPRPLIIEDLCTEKDFYLEKAY